MRPDTYQIFIESYIVYTVGWGKVTKVLIWEGMLMKTDACRICINQYTQLHGIGKGTKLFMSHFLVITPDSREICIRVVYTDGRGKGTKCFTMTFWSWEMTIGKNLKIKWYTVGRGKRVQILIYKFLVYHTHKIRVRFNPVVGGNQTKILIYEVLVVRPAAYQISTRKCKRNWKK